MNFILNIIFIVYSIQYRIFIFKIRNVIHKIFEFQIHGQFVKQHGNNMIDITI